MVVRYGRAVIGASLLVASLALASGCAPRVQNLGNAPTARALDEVKVGKSQADVTAALGSPSATGTFDPRIWYYISKRTETMAFFKPTVTEQKVIEIQFDNDGIVKSIKNYSLDQARDVSLVSDETPTIGREPGILKSLYNTLLSGGGVFGGPNSEPASRGY
ncbi:MAG: outer membrane protein assembly factor BamE [Candidatus Eiseniibacteriota bacterium]